MTRKTSKSYIQTKEDLSVAFKNNMYFGVNKTEGLRASNQNTMVSYGIDGYRHKSAHDKYQAAYLGGSQQQQATILQAFSSSASSITAASIVNKAEELIDTAAKNVKTFYLDTVNKIDDTVSSLKSKFTDVANSLSDNVEKGFEYVSDQVDDGYEYVSDKFNNAMEEGRTMLGTGLNYISTGYNSSVSTVSNFFSELKQDGTELVSNMSIASSLMFRDTKAPVLQPVLAAPQLAP